MRFFTKPFFSVAILAATLTASRSETVVHLLGVPDYGWHAGCFGTASGNLMGYWDRHGLPGYYTGPTAGGVAPLTSCGSNIGIRSMWASKAGFDGRPANKPGHMDDYWTNYVVASDFCGNIAGFSYESTGADPYVGRPEHAPDCLADFLGVSQKKWTNMNNECDGNIDAFSFVYWDTNGNRRTNFVPPPQGTNAVLDIQSGLREWSRYRGYDCEVFTQLADFNPHVPAGKGFTFAEVKAEIDAGYPVLVFLQPHYEMSRSFSGMPKGNPQIHGMLIYGYQITDDGGEYAYYRTSWGDGGGQDSISSEWSSAVWRANLPVRGVIGYHPEPKITRLTRLKGKLIFEWDGPSSEVFDAINGTTRRPHSYVIEKSTSLNPASFSLIAGPTNERTIPVDDPGGPSAFFRVRMDIH